jgi:hypothetical protein
MRPTSIAFTLVTPGLRTWTTGEGRNVLAGQDATTSRVLLVNRNDPKLQKASGRGRSWASVARQFSRIPRNRCALFTARAREFLARVIRPPWSARGHDRFRERKTRCRQPIVTINALYKADCRDRRQFRRHFPSGQPARAHCMLPTSPFLASVRLGDSSFRWTTFEQLNKLSLTWRVLLQEGDDRLVARLLCPHMGCCPQLRVRFDWVGSPLQ